MTISVWSTRTWIEKISNIWLLITIYLSIYLYLYGNRKYQIWNFVYLYITNIHSFIWFDHHHWYLGFDKNYLHSSMAHTHTHTDRQSTNNKSSPFGIEMDRFLVFSPPHHHHHHYTSSRQNNLWIFFSLFTNITWIWLDFSFFQIVSQWWSPSSS